LDQNAHDSFLKNIAASAQRYVMGPDEESLRQYVTVEASPPAVPEPAVLGFFSGAMARHYEMIYFHLSNNFSSPPTNPTSMPTWITQRTCQAVADGRHEAGFENCPATIWEVSAHRPAR
jgi:hypothetical protein